MMKTFTIKTKRLAQTFMAIFLITPTLLSAQAYTLQDDDVEVDADANIISCSYDFSNTEIIIPSTLDGVNVKGIAAEVFSQKNITAVTIPSTIETIGRSAFYYNKLTSVTFEANSMLRKIESVAFSGNNSLNSIELPTNSNATFVKYFNEDGEVFQPGDGITNFYDSYIAQVTYTLTDADVTIEDGIITVCNYDFSYTDIIIPSILNTQTVIEIADESSSRGVFADKGITSLTIPASMTKIGKNAFKGNELLEVNFEDNSNIQTIGLSAFAYNYDLSKIVLPNNITSGFINYLSENGEEFEVGDQINDFTIAYYAIAPYTLTDDDVNVIDGYIYSCTYSFDRKAISIPSTLDGQTVVGIEDFSWGSKPFYDKGIVSVQFPNTLEYIGQSSFQGNELSKLNLPSSIKTIKVYAFYANNIKNVMFDAPSNIDVIEANTFYMNTGIQINLPEHKFGSSVVYSGSNGTNYYPGDIVTDKDITLTATLPNSINNTISNESKIAVAPNPTTGNITINNNGFDGNIEVYNASGSLVKTIATQIGKTDASIIELPNGIYFFKYNSSTVIKIIKK